MRKLMGSPRSNMHSVHMIRSEAVTTVERAKELQAIARTTGDDYFIHSCLLAISKLGIGSADAQQASDEMKERFEQSKLSTPLTQSLAYDPYESQRHMRGRKSHLAAAINQNIHKHPWMGWVWLVIFVVLITGSFILAISK